MLGMQKINAGISVSGLTLMMGNFDESEDGSILCQHLTSMSVLVVFSGDICLLADEFRTPDAWSTSFCNDNGTLWKDRSQARPHWSLSGSA